MIQREPISNQVLKKHKSAQNLFKSLQVYSLWVDQKQIKENISDQKKIQNSVSTEKYTDERQQNDEVILFNSFDDEQKINDLKKLSCHIAVFDKIRQNPGKLWPFDRSGFIRDKFQYLFDLYIRQQILKYYCGKKGWKFSQKLINQHIIPVFSLLQIPKKNISTLFDCYLFEITQRYLLHTTIDKYSRLSQKMLMLELTQTWLKIKQAEISLKRDIKEVSNSFKSHFFYQILPKTNKKVFNKKQFFKYLFLNSQKQTRMVSLIKIYIWCLKVHGEDIKSAQQNFQHWISSY